jgi:N-methylhydantoinase B
LVVGDEKHYVLAVLNADGDVVSCSRSAWLPSVALTARAMLDAFGGRLDDGDLVVTNDPYAGGTHVNDFTLLRALSGGEGYVLARFHTADIGGDVLGGVVAGAREVWEEGVVLAPVLLERGTRRSADVEQMILLNSRLPDVLLGDLRVAESVLAALQDTICSNGYSDPPFHAAAVAVAEHAASDLLADASSISAGGVARLRSCCAGIDVGLAVDASLADGRLCLSVRVDEPSELGFLNSGRGVTESALLAPITAALGRHLANAGLLRCVEVRVAPGSGLCARSPAPTGHAPYTTARSLSECAHEALAGLGLRLGRHDHWFVAPPPRFAVASCGDANCPLGAGASDALRRRYSPGGEA